MVPKQTCFFPAGTHSSSAVPRLEVLWITLRGRPPDTPSDQLRARALGPTCSFPVLGKQIAWAEGGQGGLVWHLLGIHIPFSCVSGSYLR